MGCICILLLFGLMFGLSMATVATPPVCKDLVIARACVNEWGAACEMLSEATTAPTALLVDDRCLNKTLSDMADHCRKTCLSCCKAPEYDCKDNPDTSINCTKMLDEGKCKTKDLGFLEILSSECPQSCGLCSSGNCINKDPEMCNFMPAMFCKHVDFMPIMEENCAKLCKTCPTGISSTASTSPTNPPITAPPCLDVATNCGQNRGLCTESKYVDLMSSKCRGTCVCGTGRSGSNGVESCVDNNSNCPTWKAGGYCESTSYTNADKAAYCRKTCSLC